jgi:argininosuccinate synthase
VAHGCTGKGNDQVRLEVGVAALAPELQVIAPIRDWGMSREDEMEYARARHLPINARKSRFSVDENLWGRSIEAGELEDPWLQPPEEAYAWTRPIAQTPDGPLYLEIHFEQGIPTALDGESMAGPDLISHLNSVAGAHGVGRVDHVENRLVGIKSREVYEAPAAVVLHTAHKALETMTLSKEQARTKARIAQEYADVVYNGLWFTAHRHDLDAYVRSTQLYVTGDIRLQLHKGNCAVVGRSAPHALYQHHLATYDRQDRFDHSAAQGFITIYGLPVRTQNQAQLRGGAGGPSQG